MGVVEVVVIIDMVAVVDDRVVLGVVVVVKVVVFIDATEVVEDLVVAVVVVNGVVVIIDME